MLDDEAAAVDTTLFKCAGGAVEVDGEDKADDPLPLPLLPFPPLDDVGVFGDWKKLECKGDAPLLLRVDEVEGEFGLMNDDEEGRGEEGSPQVDPLPVFLNCV